MRRALVPLATLLLGLGWSGPASAYHTEEEHLTDDTAWTIAGDKAWRLGLFKAAVGIGDRLTLGSYVVLDVFLSRALTRWSELFVSVENLLDKEYAVGRTTEGVTTIGAPRLVRGGVRLSF